MKKSFVSLAPAASCLTGLRVVFVLALLSRSLPLLATTSVTLNSLISPGTGVPTVTNLHVTGHGFPSGSITPSAVIITLTPTTAGSGPTAKTRGLAVTVVSGSTERVTFRIPAAISVSSPTSYKVSIEGSTTTGNTFASSNSSSLTIESAVVIANSSPLPAGTVGVNYSQILSATGGSGTYTWAVTAGSLPGGLSLNAATGLISGQPSTAGTSNFTIQVTDSNSVVATKAFALTINAALVITSSSPLPTGQVGVNYSQTLSATGGSGIYTWAVSVGSLPAGLGLTPGTGLISGPPSTATTANFTVQVTDSNSVVTTKPFALTINPAATIQTVSPNSANAGLSLQVTITGLYTNFVQGTTQASFGPGISVGGGTAGQAGPVTVNSATSATASLTISATATTGSQTVTVITGGEQPSLANGFTILAAIPYISVNTTAPTAIATGFSGFSDPNLSHGVEYNDPKFEAAVLPLKPGFIRYPGGLVSMAFEWETAHENSTWLTNLEPDLNSSETAGLSKGSALGQAKGGVCFTSTPPGTCYSNLSELTAYVGANALVCVNGFTDTDTNSAGNMVAAASAAGLNVVEWEIGNEPYGYPLIFPTPTSYASAEYSPYYQNIVTADPTATVGLFFQGQFSSFNGHGYPAWDSGMSTYTPQYWNAVSTHIYPITSSTLTTSQEEEQLNSILGFATTDYISSYLAPLVGANTPIFITEFNSDAYGTLNFETYLYNGIFLAEFVARMSTAPNVKGVAVQPLYLGNGNQQGIIRAVNDYESYLIGQVKANPSYSTNTATNPNTQYQFYYSTSALALEVANLAINSSNAIWPTAVNGTVPTVPTSPVQGYGGTPIPAVFAQAYQGIDGTHYLLITNKSSQSMQFAIEVNGSLLEQSVTTTYVSNASDTAANTAATQTNVQVVTTSTPNPITVGPYSVTAVQW